MELEKHQQNQRFEKIIQNGGRFLLEDILSRLPVKSLLRFMCVSKHWKSLISSRSFRKLHRERHNSPLLLAFYSSEDLHPYPDKHNPDIVPDYILTTFDLFGKVVQQWTLPISSSYLDMLTYPSQSKLVCFTGPKRFFLYNPSTRQLFDHLPDPPFFSLPSIKHHIDGFGYIPSKDEYMIVHVVELNTENKWVCEVLTMSISNDNYQLHYNAWRSIEITTKLHRVCYSACVFVGGAFYFDARDENDNNCILSFHVETEVFSTFGLPQEGIPSWDTRLLELHDELYLMNVTYMPPTLDLWKMSDVNNKLWTLYWNLNLQSIGYADAPSPEIFDCKILINRREYHQYYDEPNIMLREMGKLMLEDKSTMPEEEYVMPFWSVSIHTNLFTL